MLDYRNQRIKDSACFLAMRDAGVKVDGARPSWLINMHCHKKHREIVEIYFITIGLSILLFLVILAVSFGRINLKVVNIEISIYISIFVIWLIFLLVW